MSSSILFSLFMFLPAPAKLLFFVGGGVVFLNFTRADVVHRPLEARGNAAVPERAEPKKAEPKKADEADDPELP